MAGWISTTYSSFTKHETEVPNPFINMVTEVTTWLQNKGCTRTQDLQAGFVRVCVCCRPSPTKHAETIYNKCANAKCVSAVRLWLGLKFNKGLVQVLRQGLGS